MLIGVLVYKFVSSACQPRWAFWFLIDMQPCKSIYDEKLKHSESFSNSQMENYLGSEQINFDGVNNKQELIC